MDIDKINNMMVNNGYTTCKELHRNLNPGMEYHTFKKWFADHFLKALRVKKEFYNCKPGLYSYEEMSKILTSNQLTYGKTKGVFEVWYIPYDYLTFEDLTRLDP